MSLHATRKTNGLRNVATWRDSSGPHAEGLGGVWAPRGSVVSCIHIRLHATQTRTTRRLSRVYAGKVPLDSRRRIPVRLGLSRAKRETVSVYERGFARSMTRGDRSAFRGVCFVDRPLRSFAGRREEETRQEAFRSPFVGPFSFHLFGISIRIRIPLFLFSQETVFFSSVPPFLIGVSNRKEMRLDFVSRAACVSRGNCETEERAARSSFAAKVNK